MYIIRCVHKSMNAYNFGIKNNPFSGPVLQRSFVINVSRGLVNPEHPDFITAVIPLANVIEAYKMKRGRNVLGSNIAWRDPPPLGDKQGRRKFSHTCRKGGFSWVGGGVRCANSGSHFSRQYARTPFHLTSPTATIADPAKLPLERSCHQLNFAPRRETETGGSAGARRWLRAGVAPLRP